MDEKKRVPAGRLNGVHAVVGALMGPTFTREILVVTGVDDEGVTLGYALPEDFKAAGERDPSTTAEAVVRRTEQAAQVARFNALFGH